MKRVIVVGGGVIGTMHAYLALQDGFEVFHFERDPAPQSASVRNFGLIWVSGRASGRELELALRARELWGEIGSNSTIGFRANGSLTVAKNEEEASVLQEALQLPDASQRDFHYLDEKQIRQLEPALKGNIAGGLRCGLDASVEPQLLLSGLRSSMRVNAKYTWIASTEVVDFRHDENGNHVLTDEGVWFDSEFVVFCPGAAHDGLLADFFDSSEIRRVYLQMAETAPSEVRVNHSIADIDSLRYYPAFKSLSLEKLTKQNPIAEKFGMQLLLAPRLDGAMTIGDTHEYQEPFSFVLYEEPYDHLLDVIEGFFGIRPRIHKRWSGIYSQSINSEIYFRKEIFPGMTIVTGGGGRGNTLSPAIAEESLKAWNR